MSTPRMRPMMSPNGIDPARYAARMKVSQSIVEAAASYTTRPVQSLRPRCAGASCVLKLAFCLFRYFPFGGVQRNFLRIAELCALRGHEAHLYTLRWDGPPPTGIRLILPGIPTGWPTMPAKSWCSTSGTGAVGCASAPCRRAARPEFRRANRSAPRRRRRSSRRERRCPE
jgi:hypothetical protein